MDYVVITGARPYDGRYEFALEIAGLTTLEWGWIKRFSGYLPLTVMDGYRGGDAELFTVFAVIALHRNGAVTEDDIPAVFAKLQRLAFDDTIALESDPDPAEVGDTEGPPTETSSSVNGGSNAVASTTSSERSAPTPAATGTPASATSASAPTTSVR